MNRIVLPISAAPSVRFLEADEKSLAWSTRLVCGLPISLACGDFQGLSDQVVFERGSLRARVLRSYAA